MNHNEPILGELESLLEFYQAAGVDACLTENPLDWFEESARQTTKRLQHGHNPPRETAEHAERPPSRQPSGSSVMPVGAAPSVQGPATGHTATIPDAAVVESARDAAAKAQNLETLCSILEEFEGCNLKLSAKNLVFADGVPNARLMLVGEAPGRDEDLQGKPFVGRSGQLLDRMLHAIGLDRTNVYIANVVPWRPPGNRTPTPQETEICKPFIKRQIELANPDMLVFLGAASAKTLLGVQDGIRKMRGRWMTYDLNGRTIPCVATYHPAYLLRSPLEKRLSWRDFLSIRSKLHKQDNEHI